MSLFDERVNAFHQAMAEHPDHPRWKSYEFITEDRAQDSILERLTEIGLEIGSLVDERERLHRQLRDLGSPYAASLVDRDGRGADEDSDRIAREIADEKAAAGIGRIGP